MKPRRDLRTRLTRQAAPVRPSARLRPEELTAAIERALEEKLAFVGAERNGPELWQRVRTIVEDSVLHPLWRDGHLQGVKPQDAYFARCDTSTMTQQDLAEGRLVVLAGFAPIRPAEFEIVRSVHGTAAQPA